MTDTGTCHRSPLSLLLEVSRRQQTGIVRVEFGSSKRQIAARQGLLAYAESNVQEEHLVHVLVKMKLIPRTAIQPVASLMKAGLTADQAVLRAAELCVSDLEKGLSEQATVILSSILGRDGGRVRFFEGSNLLRRHVSLDEPVPQALLLASRRAVSERRLSPSLIVPTGYLTPAESGSDDHHMFPLDSPEAYALHLIEGPTSLDEAVQSLEPTGRDPRELLLTLVLLGLLRLEARIADGDASRFGDDDWSRLELDRLLERCETANLYEILHVTPEATEEEIKASYHDLARKYHPDRYHSADDGADLHAKAEKLFSLINEAHSTLASPESRAAYDAERTKKESRVAASIQSRSSIDKEQEEIAAGLYRAGRLALAAHNFEKAVTHLKECVWLRPKVAAYHHYLGVAQKEIPKLHKEAEKHLLKALELDSTSIDSHLELGKLYLKVSLPNRAAVQLEQVLRWVPAHEEAQRLLNGIKR